MKILITTDWYESTINGVVTSVNNLVKGLLERGHDVKILTLSQSYNSYVKNNVYYIGSVNAKKIYPCARIRIPMKNKLILNIIKWKPDIIHSQCEFNTFSLAKRISSALNSPIVHTYHTVYEDYTHYFSPNIKLGKNAVKLFTKYIAKNVSLMIAPTEKVRNILDSYGCETPISVVPTGLDLSEIVSQSTEQERRTFKKQLNISDNSKVILFAGRLAEEKNLDEIITYLGKIKLTNTVFLIVGDGPYKNEIKNKIKSCKISNMTIMTGMVSPDTIKNYYAISDIFISSSKSETQGLTYIEALANGVPLLCRKDRCLDGVLIDGKSGYAFDNFHEFSEKLHYMLNNDLSDFKKYAVDMIKQNFSSDNFTESIERLYKLCLCKELAFSA